MFKGIPPVHALMPVLLFNPRGWEMVVMIVVNSDLTPRIQHFLNDLIQSADIGFKNFNKSAFIGRKPQL